MIRGVASPTPTSPATIASINTRSRAPSTCAPSGPYTLIPLSVGGLWLAEITMPAPQPCWRTKYESCGVGRGSSTNTTSLPREPSACATTSAKPRLLARVSNTIATLSAVEANSADCIAAHRPNAVSRMTWSLTRLGPGPQGPRRPPVPIGKGPENASSSSASAALDSAPVPLSARVTKSRKTDRSSPVSDVGQAAIAARICSGSASRSTPSTWELWFGTGEILPRPRTFAARSLGRARSGRYASTTRRTMEH